GVVATAGSRELAHARIRLPRLLDALVQLVDFLLAETAASQVPVFLRIENGAIARVWYAPAGTILKFEHALRIVRHINLAPQELAFPHGLDDFGTGAQMRGVQHPHVALVMPHRGHVDEDAVESGLEEARASRKLHIDPVHEYLKHHLLHLLLHGLGRGRARKEGDIEIIVVRDEVLLAAIAEQASANEVDLVTKLPLEVFLELQVGLQRAILPFLVPVQAKRKHALLVDEPVTLQFLEQRAIAAVEAGASQLQPFPGIQEISFRRAHGYRGPAREGLDGGLLEIEVELAPSPLVSRYFAGVDHPHQSVVDEQANPLDAGIHLAADHETLARYPLRQPGADRLR